MPKVNEEELPEYRKIGYSGRNYKIVKGSLEGTRVWECDNFAYTYERENGKISTVGGLHPMVKLKCRRYHAKYGKCPVRAVVCEDGLLEIRRGEHNHSGEEEKAQLTQNAASHIVKERMRQDPTADPKDIFDSYDGEGATDLEYWRKCRQLQNIKNQALPRAPRNIEEVIAAVRASEYSYLLQDVARYNEHTALIWYHESLNRILTEWQITEISADATFRVVPEVFGENGQHFTLLGRFRDNWLPMVHVTMTCKVEGLYQSALDRIKHLLPAFAPRIAHCDFEHAIANSLETVFGCEIKGCFFHHNSAVRKKVGKVGLLSETNKNRYLDAWCRSFYPLPLLPPHKMEDGFHWVENQLPAVLATIQSDGKKMECGAMCNRVLRYYWRFWFGNVGVERVSVYKQAHRTNNGAENYHSRLNKGLPRRPKFWLYPPRIKKFISAFVLDVERLNKGLQLTRANKETEVQKRINQYTAEFDQSQDLDTFMKCCRWLGCKKVKCESSSEEEEEEEAEGTGAEAAGGGVTPPPRQTQISLPQR